MKAWVYQPGCNVIGLFIKPSGAGGSEFDFVFESSDVEGAPSSHFTGPLGIVSP
jgi:hypothetical protein